MCNICVFTVASLMNRCAAASRFVDPRHVLQHLQLAWAHRLLHRLTHLTEQTSRDGRRQRSLATRRGADSADSSSRGASFNKYPVAPASLAGSTSESLSRVVRDLGNSVTSVALDGPAKVLPLS
jgi:hypothetical protein